MPGCSVRASGKRSQSLDYSARGAGPHPNIM